MFGRKVINAESDAQLSNSISSVINIFSRSRPQKTDENGTNGDLDPLTFNHENNDDCKFPKPDWLLARESNPDVDGGWGWWVVFGSFLIHVFADGINYSFGIIIMEIIDNFGTGTGDTSWIFSILVGLTYASGPVASIMTNVFGCRVTTITGGFFLCFGFALSIFATNIYYLYFTIGILAGVGNGLVYLPGVVILSQYFEKRRSFALGIAACGAGMGTFIFPPIIRALIDIYAWRGTCLILSAILLNCVCCGMLFRPLPVLKLAELITEEQTTIENSEKQIKDAQIEEQKIKEALYQKLYDHIRKTEVDCKKEEKSSNIVTSCPNLLSPRPHKEKKEPVSFASGFIYDKPEIDHMISKRQEEIHRELEILSAYKSCHMISLISLVPIPEIEESIYDSEGEIMVRPWHVTLRANISDAFKQLTDYGLIKNYNFMLFAVSNFFTSLAMHAPYIYIIDLADMRGIAKSSATFLISVIGIGNTFGRLFFGRIADVPQIVRSRDGNGRLLIYVFANIINGVFTLLAPLMMSYPLLITYASVYGILIGTYITLTAVVLVDLIGLDRLTSSFGILLLFQGAATFIGPPIAGWIYDSTKNFDISFYVLGALLAFSGVMLLIYFAPCIYRDYFLPNLPREDLIDIEDEDFVDAELLAAVQMASRRTSMVVLEPRRGSRADIKRRASLASRRTSLASRRASVMADRKRRASSNSDDMTMSRRTSSATNQDWAGSRPMWLNSRRGSKLSTSAA